VDLRSVEVLSVIALLCYIILSNSIAFSHAPYYQSSQTSQNGHTFNLGRDHKQGVILSTYFTTTKDPQRLQMLNSNNYTYIQPLFESALKLNVPLILFHDSLSETFIQEHSHPLVEFIKVELRKSMSQNDERFLFYQELLRTRGFSQKYKYVFLSDVSDVFLFDNPFNAIEKLSDLRSQQQSPECSIWLARESESLRDRKSLFTPCYPSKSNFVNINFDYDAPIYNAGVIIGTVENVLELLDHIIREIARMDVGENSNCNLAALQYSIQHFYSPANICSEGICWRDKCDSFRFVHHKLPEVVNN